jgi:hypothetical protein
MRNGSPRGRGLAGLVGAGLLVALCALTALCVSAIPQDSVHSSIDSDIPKAFTSPTTNQDYVKREVMIPMRDGVKLHTVIVVPKGAKNAPILLTRTPYNASKRTARNNSPHMLARSIRRRRLHSRFPGCPRQVQIRGRLRHDPTSPGPVKPHCDGPCD